MHLEDYLSENVDFVNPQPCYEEQEDLFDKTFSKEVIDKYNVLCPEVISSIRFRRQFYDFIVDSGINYFYQKTEKFCLNFGIQFTQQHLIGAEKVLDIGCADGLNAVWYSLQNSGAEIFGIDFSKKLVEKFKKRIEKYELKNCFSIIGDARVLPFKENFFDAVVGCRIFHELQDDNIDAFESFNILIPEALRVVKPEGKIVGTLPVPDGNAGHYVESFLKTILEKKSAKNYSSQYIKDPLDKNNLVFFEAVKS